MRLWHIREEQGIVSLLASIIISLLLIIITTSLITIEALQLRKAEDSEQTLRAYYTAEAGVEQAVAKILNKDPSVWNGSTWINQACVGDSGYDPGAGQAGWTCQQVSFSGTPEGELPQADQAVTIDPGNIGPPTWKSVLIEWNQSANAAGYSIPGMFTSNAPTAAQFAFSGYSAPPLEVSLLDYPSGGFNSGSVCSNYVGSGNWQPAGCTVHLQNLLLAPDDVSGSGTADFSNSTFSTGGPVQANCGPLGRTLPNNIDSSGTGLAYNCWAVITHMNNPGTDFLFRLRSRYTASNYKMVFCTDQVGAQCGNGNTVAVPDGTATIDVTAKAGQTFRRVVSKLPITNGAAAGLNYVMYSDNDICKNFTVVNDTAQAPYPCP